MNQVVIFFNDAPVYPVGVNAGGGESATLALAKAIAALGWKVIACANLPEGEVVADGIKFWNFGKGYRLDQVMPRLHKIGQFYCISSSIAHPFLFLRENKNCLSRVIINHSPSESASGLDLATVFDLIDTMLCVSHAQLEMLREKTIGPFKAQVVKNGFDPNLFQYSGPEKRDFNHIIFVGRVDAWKGAHLLIDAFRALKKFLPNLKASLYGDYSHWEPMRLLKEKVEQENKDIHFYGKVPQTQIAAALREAGLLVFPSICFESAGLGVVDAQASGCPVLGFDTGGVKEYLLNGECGVLQTENSLEAFVKTLHHMLSNPSQLAQYSRNCLAKARVRTWEVVAKDVIKILQSLTKNHITSPAEQALEQLRLVPAVYRIINFSNYSPNQLLEDHQLIASGAEVSWSLIQQALSSGSEQSAINLCAGLQLEQKGLKNDALTHYKAALNFSKHDDWQPDFCMTLLYSDLKDLISAGQCARNVLRKNPNFPLASMLQQIIDASGSK
jgi:glycosyltransferase involved in cell wall biosynthesis